MERNELQEKLLSFFQDLHRHPELSGQEVRTTRRVKEALLAAGIEVLDEGLATGLVARIRGGRPGPVVALRADMDALPLQEETDLPYASENPDVMHACGHDYHTTVMLGAALQLQTEAASLPGTALVIFQPSEEVDDGACRILRTGYVDQAGAVFGIHSYPHFPSGKLGIKEGPVMAAVDRFDVRIIGRGAHAAHPHKGLDPIVILAAVIQSLQTLVSRRLDPFSSAVVTVGHVEAGTAYNIIPNEARMEGTLRTLDEAERSMLRESFLRMVSGIAEAHGARAEIDWESGSPAVVNDAALCGLCRETAAACGFEVGRQEDTMGAEDFSEYLQGRPGVFVRVGTGGDYPAHHPKFAVDPSGLAQASLYFAALAGAWLRREEKA